MRKPWKQLYPIYKSDEKISQVETSKNFVEITVITNTVIENFDYYLLHRKHIKTTKIFTSKVNKSVTTKNKFENFIKKSYPKNDLNINNDCPKKTPLLLLNE